MGASLVQFLIFCKRSSSDRNCLLLQKLSLLPFALGRLKMPSPRVGAPCFRHWTVIGLATRGIITIESCKVNVPTENQIPVAWNG